MINKATKLTTPSIKKDAPLNVLAVDENIMLFITGLIAFTILHITSYIAYRLPAILKEQRFHFIYNGSDKLHVVIVMQRV